MLLRWTVSKILVFPVVENVAQQFYHAGIYNSLKFKG
jgi:hypothetical protein